MTPRLDLVDDIIGVLEPEDIPFHFIKMAKVRDFDGEERILRGRELHDFLANPFSAAEVSVMLDIKAIKAAIIDYLEDISAEVKQRLK